MSVVTVQELKLHIGLSPAITTEDARLQQMLDGVEEACWQWIGRERVEGYSPFDQVEATEYYDGTGRAMLLLKRRPVVLGAGISVWVDPAGYYGQNPAGFADPATLWQYGTAYAPTRLDESESNPGILTAFLGLVPTWQGQVTHPASWPAGRGNIKVKYTAGYKTMPFDLTNAICNVAAAVRNSAARGAQMESETIGRYTYQLMKSGGKAGGTLDVDEIGMALSTLARYKEVNV